jgi:DNA-binding beta-propeller fold protein YncE
MRAKQQKLRPRATTAARTMVTLTTAAVALTGALIAAAAVPAAAAAVPAAARVIATPGGGTPGGLMVPGQPIGIAADPTTKTFWIAELNAGQPTDIVNKVTETSHAISTFKVTSGVNGIAADPSKGLVWTIGNSSDGSTHTVTYIKESTGSVKTLTIPADSDLTGITVDPKTGTVLVLDLSGDVYTIDEAEPTKAPVKLVTGSLSAASNLAVDPAKGTIWVLNALGNSALAFSETNGAAVGDPVPVGSNPGVITIDPTNGTVWVGAADGTISEFSQADPGTVHTLTLASPPIALAAEPSHKVIWAGSQSGVVDEITEKTPAPSLIGSLTLPEEVDGLATDGTTGQLWATENVTSQGVFDNLVPLAPSAPAITSAPSTWFATDNAGQDAFSVITSGFPPANYTITGAPSWLTIDKYTGALSAALTHKSKPGAFTVTITATNRIGAVAHQAFTANVGSDPVVKTTSGTFAYGVKNSLRIEATGTPAKIGFTGLGLSKYLSLGAAGLLSGTPPKGTKSPVEFVVLANNKVTKTFHQPVEAVFTLNLAPGQAPKITSASKVTFKPGKDGSFTIESTGFPTPAIKISGKLPQGLKLRTSAGSAVLSGTPATTDKGRTYKLTVTAKNGITRPATQTLTIKIT